MVGNVVADQFLSVGDYPFGAALAIVLTVIVMLALVALRRGERSGPVSRVSRRLPKPRVIFTALVLVCLYAPIVLVLVISVNADPSLLRWEGFTLDWYRQAFDDERRARRTSGPACRSPSRPPRSRSSSPSPAGSGTADATAAGARVVRRDDLHADRAARGGLRARPVRAVRRVGRRARGRRRSSWVTSCSTRPTRRSSSRRASRRCAARWRRRPRTSAPTRWRVFRRVTLPLLMPAIVVAGLLVLHVLARQRDHVAVPRRDRRADAARARAGQDPPARDAGGQRHRRPGSWSSRCVTFLDRRAHRAAAPDGRRRRARPRTRRRGRVSTAIALRDLRKVYGDVAAVERRRRRDRRRRVLLAHRAERLRQDDDAADDRGARRADRGRDRGARARRHDAAAAQAPGEHGLPAVRAVPAPHDLRERRLRAARAAASPRREIRTRVGEMLELVDLDGRGRRRSRGSSPAASSSASRSPASLVLRARGAAARRAARRARPQAAQAAAAAAQAHPARGRHHVRLRDARPGGGVLDVGPRRRSCAAGCIEQLGTPRDVYQRPATEFVADFVGVSNRRPGTVTGVVADGRYAVDVPGLGAIASGGVTGPGRRARRWRSSCGPESVLARPGGGRAHERLGPACSTSRSWARTSPASSRRRRRRVDDAHRRRPSDARGRRPVRHRLVARRRPGCCRWTRRRPPRPPRPRSPSRSETAAGRRHRRRRPGGRRRRDAARRRRGCGSSASSRATGTTRRTSRARTPGYELAMRSTWSADPNVRGAEADYPIAVDGVGDHAAHVRRRRRQHDPLQRRLVPAAPVGLPGAHARRRRRRLADLLRRPRALLRRDRHRVRRQRPGRRPLAAAHARRSRIRRCRSGRGGRLVAGGARPARVALVAGDERDRPRRVRAVGHVPGGLPRGREGVRRPHALAARRSRPAPTCAPARARRASSSTCAGARAAWSTSTATAARTSRAAASSCSRRTASARRGSCCSRGSRNRSGLVGRRLMVHPFATVAGVVRRAAGVLGRPRRAEDRLLRVLRDRRGARVRARRQVEPRRHRRPGRRSRWRAGGEDCRAVRGASGAR